MTKLNNKMVKVGLAVVGSVAGLAVVIIGSKKMAKGAKTMNKNNLNKDLEKENYTSIFTGDDYKLAFTEVDEELVKEITHSVSEALKDNSIEINEEFLPLLIQEILYSDEDNDEAWINDFGIEAFDFIEEHVLLYGNTDGSDSEDEITEEDIDKIVNNLKDKCDTTKDLLKLIVKEMLLGIFNEKHWNGVLDAETICLVENCISMYIEYGVFEN